MLYLYILFIEPKETGEKVAAAETPEGHQVQEEEQQEGVPRKLKIKK